MVVCVLILIVLLLVLLASCANRLIRFFRPFGRSWIEFETPKYYRIFWRPEDLRSQQLMLEKYSSVFLNKRCIRKIKQVLPEHGLDEFTELVINADYRVVRPMQPWKVGGWSQTRSHSDSSIILGLEQFLVNLGHVTKSACGHELVHVAQEVRDSAMSKEWEGLGSWTWVKLEFEALCKFSLCTYILLAAIFAGVTLIWQLSGYLYDLYDKLYP